MARPPLRGGRYLREGNEEDAALCIFVKDELPYLDFGEALRFYATVTPHLDNNQLAFLGCNDRFWFLTAVLGRKDAIHPWLYDRAREVEASPDGHLDLWAREHYKSTIITFAGILQEVMTDPEITVGIFSHTKDVACKFLKQIMQELERNDTLRILYPDVCWEFPRVQAPSWAEKSGITVKRASNPKEATIEAHGLVDGQPTGRHFALLVYDDVVTRESVTNPDMVKKTTEAWELSDNLGAGAVRKWHIGTRYSFADTYGVILERKVLKPRIYPATENGRLDGKLVFMDAKRWAEKKKTQRSTIAAQMLQNPLAGSENTFKAEWLRGWDIRPANLVVYIMADPSKGRSATSDRTAMMVVGIDDRGNKYLLDGVRHRMQLSQRWATLRDFYRKWSRMPGVQHVVVGYETYGQQTDHEYFEERMKLEGIGFPIEELNWVREGNQSKKDRVERLEPDFRLSRFFLPAVIQEPGVGECYWSVDVERSHIVTRPKRGPTKAMQQLAAVGVHHRICKPIWHKDEDGKAYDVTRALMEEMLFFPFSPKDDAVDALARIYDLNPTGPVIHEDRTLEAALEHAPPDA